MTDFSPLPWTYQGGGTMCATTAYFAKLCDDRFVHGQKYLLVEHQDRSAASHNHYFAALHEAWTNLPEPIALEFPTSEHLRKRALIMSGFRDERSIVCASKAEARRFASFIKPMDDFAVVSIHECAVVVWTAKSQSQKAMGRKDFQRSKEAVLAFAWELVGVEPDVGNAQAGQAA